MEYTLQWQPAPGGPGADPEEVAAALGRAAAGAMLTRPEPDRPVFHYENPRTRVAATLAVGPGITARLPLPRARFHLLEVEQILRRVQADLGGTVTAIGLEGEADWAEATRRALAALGPQAAEYTPLPPEHGETWWRFTMARQALRLAWPSADVVIPDVMLVRPRDGGAAARLVIWPEQASSLVLPEAEFVAIRRIPRPFATASARTPGGLIPWAEAVATLQDALERHEEPLPHWLYRGGEAHPFRIRALLDQARVPGSAYRPVSPDRVVDGP